MYNERVVRRIEAFEQRVNASRLPPDTGRKLLSILSSLEYQVEEGECPLPVIRHLQAAMQSWIDTLVTRRNTLSRGLTNCIDRVVEEMGLPNKID